MKPDLSRNANRFVIFSVFFSARAYYPVLAILFLDLGLSLDQFVLLNMIWAATIFVFEVPSGALADTLGRRKLLLAAAVLMVVEMLCLLSAPRNGGTLLLVLCVINRICSGLSEACASGANEALAYDSLACEGRADAWDQLLARTLRWRAVGFVLAMIIGGFLYDPRAVNALLPDALAITTNMAQRLPVLLVLGQALVCLWVCWRMVEPARGVSGSTLRQTIELTLATARWVFTRPILVVVLFIGVAIDSITRNFATIDSRYFRLIALPEWSYGVIGAAIGVLGWFVPALARRLNNRFGVLTNLAIVAGVVVICLLGLVPAWPWVGIVPVMLLMTVMGLLEFTTSRVFQGEADSARRATVLSVKGLVFNLGYGLFSLGFAGLLANFPDQPEGAALRSALWWQVPYFAVLMFGLFVWANYYVRGNRSV